MEKFLIKLIYNFFKFKNQFGDLSSKIKFNKNLNELPFTVVITSYNNINYFKKNLESVVNQNYSNFDVIYVDDCSTDGTSQEVQEFINKFDFQKKVKYVRNEIRKKKVENLYSVINALPSERIVLELDGDDYLSDLQVLNLFNNYYQNSGAWIVYGNYENYPDQLAQKLKIKKFFQSVPQFILKLNKIRLYPWVFSGLRSYYAGLFKKIKKESVISVALGDFFPLCGDAAIFYPMLEMAKNKVASIDKIVLLRNIDSPINDFKKYDSKFRKMVWNEICSKTKYGQVEKLF